MGPRFLNSKDENVATIVTPVPVSNDGMEPQKKERKDDRIVLPEDNVLVVPANAKSQRGRKR